MPRRPRDEDDDDDLDDRPDLRRRRKQLKQEKKNQMLYILLAGVAVVVMVCGGAAWFVASAVKQVAKVAREVTPREHLDEAGPPTAKVTAEALYKAFEKKEAKADRDYTDESIQVTGAVATVEQVPGGWRVTLTTGLTHARVVAEFEPGKGPKVSQLLPGQSCSIVGICEGKTTDPLGFWVVSLYGCRLAE